VTSALPLVQAVRAQLHPAQIVFTAATRSGRELAETLIRPHVDLVLFSPFDLWFSVRRYIVAIRPSLFVLVETDFWPEWLHMLHQEKVPTMLVNGRISSKSFASYRRFAFFCKPMFRCFDLLAMQTEQDREKMAAFGLPKERLAVLGNLKYDLPAPQSSPLALVPDNELLWVCGSTHPGEEEIIFAAFQQLLAETELHGTLHLLLAPRQINRGEKLLRLASSFGFVAQLRSSGGRSAAGRVLIVDSLGELAGCYSAARLAFIGGSLAAEGGHNPLEAAAQGVPVLFGPHTDDFAEITRDLTECGGAKRVTEASLAATAALILTDETVHAAMANAAKRLVKQQRGAAARHLSAINLLLRQD
jgi:3-deoxy-D-manno-octulosonic-acid transferase